MRLNDPKIFVLFDVKLTFNSFPACHQTLGHINGFVYQLPYVTKSVYFGNVTPDLITRTGVRQEYSFAAYR